ncbi:MAG: decaprenyl-phosphate phosphoribosyltransferase [bacterium]
MQNQAGYQAHQRSDSLARALLETARPQQWIKNLFVFAALVFSHELFHLTPCLRASVAFVVFCLFSSSVYFLNDVVDIERDRSHPDKRNRPLPSGRLSVRAALVASAFLTLLAGGISLIALNPWFLAVAVTYVLINIAYSFHLKSVVLLDCMAVAGGFVLRTYAGAIAIGAVMSDWLYLCALLIALFLAFCKRRHEVALLRESAADHRGILDEYPLEFLDQLIAILTGATLVSYSLYTLDEKVISGLGRGEGLKLTIPFVIYGLLRYHYLVYRHQEGGNPTDLLLRDKPLMVNFALWLVVILIIFYS